MGLWGRQSLVRGWRSRSRIVLVFLQCFCSFLAFLQHLCCGSKNIPCLQMVPQDCILDPRTPVKNLIIDTDPGVDDAVMLLLALGMMVLCVFSPLCNYDFFLSKSLMPFLSAFVSKCVAFIVDLLKAQLSIVTHTSHISFKYHCYGLMLYMASLLLHSS